MGKADITSVEEYIAAQPEQVRDILQTVRSTIRKALPHAEETISYQIPAYKVDGRAVFYFAAWKQHYSVYPASEEMAVAFRAELAPYAISKGTIRFPLDRRVPAGLIGRLAKFRATELAKREQAKASRARAGNRRSSV